MTRLVTQKINPFLGGTAEDSPAKSRAPRKPRATKAVCPTEHQEQSLLMSMAALHEHRAPELWLLHAIPNGTYTTKAMRGRAKAEGRKPGAPDMCLPVARGGYHGLYIELKRLHGGRVAPEQREWHERLQKQGYAVHVCRGCDEAWRVITEYLSGL